MIKVNYNSYSSQKALDYILYMMMASQFHKTICTNSIKEEQLLNNYRNLREAEQMKMEDACAYFTDEVITPYFSEDWLSSEVEVHFNSKDKDRTEIHFTGRKQRFRICMISRYQLDGSFLVEVMSVTPDECRTWAYQISCRMNQRTRQSLVQAECLHSTRRVRMETGRSVSGQPVSSQSVSGQSGEGHKAA